MVVYFTVVIYVPVLSYSIGSALLLRAFVVDISNDLSFLNVFVYYDYGQQQQRQPSEDNFSTKQMMERFLGVIKEFTLVKKFSLRKSVWPLLRKSLKTYLCNFRFVNEFNASFKLSMTFIYIWARLTIWSSTTELIFQLVRYIVLG